MVKNLKLNQVIYADCMNEENGLPTLEDKSFDLCLTDPPYNIDFKGKKSSNYRNQREMIYYVDKKENYMDWNKSWFNEVLRISNGIIFTPGMRNLYDWINFRKPDYELKIWYKSNDACFRTYEPILLYGKIKNINQWGPNVWNIPLVIKEDYIHPCPKSYNLWYKILRKLIPSSVLDPFLGSGTTAQVCKRLSIPYLAYEIEEKYKVDIDKRLAITKPEKRKKQDPLW